MALPRILVEHRQHLERLPMLGAVEEEIVRPDVLAVGDDTGTHGRWPAPLARTAPRQAQPLLFPDGPHPLVIDALPASAEQRRDPSVAIAPMLLGQGPHLSHESVPLLRRTWVVPLARSAHAQRPAGRALRHPRRRHLVHQLPLLAHAKPLFSSASLRASLASICSATSRLSRAFSASSCFSRRRCGTSK